jgi:protocatechuate 3,4-dioxygenase alpha subunit
MAWAVSEARPARDEWVVEGIVRDGSGDPVPDAVLETWQPTLELSHPPGGAVGFQRAYTNDDGRFSFLVRRTEGSIEPVHVTLFARGLLAELRTRFYPALSADRLAGLAGLERVAADRLRTLTAEAIDPGRRVLSWSIRLQGDDETVFFAFP